MNAEDQPSQWEEDQNDPDNWMIIPEFGVRPRDVDFAGFALPIVCPGDHDTLSHDIRDVVRGLRSLARAAFPSLTALHEADARAMEIMWPTNDDGSPGPEGNYTQLSRAEILAARYNMIMLDLIDAVYGDFRYRGDKRSVDARKTAASLGSVSVELMAWLLQAPMKFDRPSLDRLKHRSSIGGKRSGQTRKLDADADYAQIVAAAAALGWPANRRGMNAIIAEKLGFSTEKVRLALLAEIANRSGSMGK